MKKSFIFLALFFMSCFTLYAQTEEVAYVDGVYEGKHSFIRVSVTVKGGRISDVEILEHGGGGQVYADMVKPLTDEIVKKKSPDVDVVTGATVSSKNLKKAVNNALQKAKPLVLTEENNAGTYTVRKNRVLEVTLPANATTGFSWSVKEIDPEMVEQIGVKKYLPESDLIGAGGHATFRFRAIGKGKTSIKLAYSRPWEVDTPPEKTFIVHLKIT